jgi:ELWxxDGT repeat protein
MAYRYRFNNVFSFRHFRRRSTIAARHVTSNRRLFVEALENRRLLAAMPQLVKDISTSTGGSNPLYLTEVGATVFFTASTPSTGRELWKTDGTETGTLRVKDINPGSGNSFPDSLANVNGTLYFRANDGQSGFELWKSDGTEAGTLRVKDINPGSNGAFAQPSSPSLTNVNGMLYFHADDGTSGRELWKSDGTEAGTVRVKDINPGGDNSLPYSLTNFNGTLYFIATTGQQDSELWKSNGTEAGTVRVKNIAPGTNPAFFPPFPSLTDVNGTLYFGAADGPSGLELWKSDGTAAGTRRVKDIIPGLVNSNPKYLTNVNGTLFFIANDAQSGYELWKSDGTGAGTLRVKDINPGSNGAFSLYSSPSLTNVNGTLFFRAPTGQQDSELWKSDGTEPGTVRVKDIRPGIRGSNPLSLRNVNGSLYFAADDGVAGVELWTSDGTEAGTVLVTDLFKGAGSGSPGGFMDFRGRMYFSAADDLHGDELWVLDLSQPADDRNQDGLIDVGDLDALCAAISGGTAARDEIEGFWSRQNTGPGDANFDHLFDSSDLVSVFQRGKYESNSPATWSDGDWNCDGVFGSGDLIAAFQRGWYEAAPDNAISGVIDAMTSHKPAAKRLYSTRK